MSTSRMFLKKALVGWLAYAMAFGPATPAMAQVADNVVTSNDYSNVPLPAKKRPNPNLIFAIDDSGSMDNEVSLNGNDGAGWYYTAGLTQGSGTVDGKTTPSFWGLNQLDKQQIGVPNFNNAGNANGTWKKYVALFPNGYYDGNISSTGDRRTYPDADQDHFAISPSQQFGPMRSPDFNKQYYNPTTVYLPWKPYNDGTTSCPSGTATGTGTTWLCTPGNARPTAARFHPIYGTGTIDLTTDVPANTTAGYYFRMYDGMRILAGSQFRRCTNTGDNSGCEGWQTANSLLCIGDSTAALTSCNAGSAGLGAGLATQSGSTWTQGSGGQSQIKMSTYDHIEAAMPYFPARVFLSASSTVVDPTQYTGFPAATTNGPNNETFRLVEIRPTTATYPKAASRTDCAASTYCTYAEEIQNFANWFQYYRKRTMSLNAAIGNSLDGLNSLRAGMFTFNNFQNVTMYDFDTVGDFTRNERRVIGLAYNLKGDGGTPTRETLDYLGRQYMRNGSGAPITSACQFNAGFIITDGFATNGGPTSPYANDDSASPTTNPFTKQYNADPTIVKTDPYQDKWSDTLADMAMYYYSTNLRPDLTKGRVPVDQNDLAPDADKNNNLHMNTYGLVLGLSGWMFANSAYPNENADPYTNRPNWDMNDSRNMARNPSAIDELWHATINGRGTMLRADSPEETRNAMLDVVNNVVAKGGAAAAVSVSNAIPTAGDNFTYQTSYNAGAWAGDLNAYNIDLITGAVSATPAWPVSAHRQLADMDWTTRLVVTYDPDPASVTTPPSPPRGGIPFQWANLNAAKQQPALTGMNVGGTAIPGSWVLDWLRGDRSREGQFLRSRGPRKDPVTGKWKNNVIPNNVAVLGDLVNAEPLYVREPRANFSDEGYAAFKSGPAASRKRVLYVAGNDGMVHIFDAVTGAELWAYVPSAGFLAQTGFSSTGLRNQADKEFFIHRMLVDATPFTSDIDFAKAGNTSTGTSNWATMVVGGLGKGGRGYYALNATNSAVTDETQAATKVMWEFPNSTTASTDKANMGYTFGRPIIAKTQAMGWVVLVTSGYENGNETGGDGRGHLFVLNPKDGTVIADIPTLDADGTIDATDRRNNPIGLAFISAFAASPNTDATIDYVYGGDLNGNVWRFDLSGPDKTSWKAYKLATLVDGSGKPQPVTSEPELGLVGSNRVVYVGTGRYYGDKDIPGATSAYYSATGTQTLYALKDDQTATPLITGRSQLTQQTVTKDLATGTVKVTKNTVDFNTGKGWYVDFPDTGERVITNPSLAAGVLAVTANIPDGTDECLPGGHSWLYAFDYRTGSFIPGSTYAGRFLGDALASRVNMIRVGSGIKGLIRTSAGETTVADEPGRATAFSAKRKAWREVLR